MIKETSLISHKKIQQYKNKAASMLYEGLFLLRASCRRCLKYYYNLKLCSFLLVETKISIQSFNRYLLSYIVAKSYKLSKQPIYFGLIICTTSVKYIFLASKPFENFLTKPAFSIFFALEMMGLIKKQKRLMKFNALASVKKQKLQNVTKQLQSH